jgi:hypothetical protein
VGTGAMYRIASPLSLKTQVIRHFEGPTMLGVHHHNFVKCSPKLDSCPALQNKPYVHLRFGFAMLALVRIRVELHTRLLVFSNMFLSACEYFMSGKLDDVLAIFKTHRIRVRNVFGIYYRNHHFDISRRRLWKLFFSIF